MLNLLGALKVFGKKSVVFITIITMLLLLGGALYWKYENVKSSLISANEELSTLIIDLQTSEQSLQTLRQDAKVTEKLLVDKQEKWKVAQQRSTQLSEQLKQEKLENEDLQECLSIDMSPYAARVLQFPSYQNRDKSGGGDTE